MMSRSIFLKCYVRLIWKIRKIAILANGVIFITTFANLTYVTKLKGHNHGEMKNVLHCVCSCALCHHKILLIFYYLLEEI